MKKWTAMLLVLAMCFALCACGGNSGDDANDTKADPKTTDAAQEEAKEPEFVLEHGIRFGMTLDEVTEREPCEVDTSDGVQNGYLCGYVTPEKGEDWTEYESYDDASEFYWFDPDTKELREFMVILGDYGDAEASAARYAELVSSFTERYGQPTDLADDDHTYAYDYLVGNFKSGDDFDHEGELLKSAMWIVPDGEGSVKIELLGGTIFGDSYVTYIGIRAFD